MPLPILDLRPLCRRIHDGHEAGVSFLGSGTSGRIERCNIYKNKGAGVWIEGGATPVLMACRCSKAGMEGYCTYAYCFSP